MNCSNLLFSHTPVLGLETSHQQHWCSAKFERSWTLLYMVDYSNEPIASLWRTASDIRRQIRHASQQTPASIGFPWQKERTNESETWIDSMRAQRTWEQWSRSTRIHNDSRCVRLCMRMHWNSIWWFAKLIRRGLKLFEWTQVRYEVEDAWDNTENSLKIFQ